MPTVTGVVPIAAALAGLRLASPITHGAITVVPLLGPVTTEPDWLTLVDAGDVVTITEVSEQGAVPTLEISNKTDRPVLLLDGEELVGAKQNRVVNTTVLVAAGLTATIPVSCVEHGRWNSVSRRFAAGEVSLLASLRRRKAGRVSASLREGRGHVSDQREIWADLAESAGRLDVASPTDAMHALYEDHATDIEAIRNALGAIERQVGALVYVAGRWAGLELLASPGLFRRAWSRLCAGYAVDALGAPASEGFEPDGEAVLTLLARAIAEPAPAVGLGEEYRLGGTVLGAALVADGRVAHLSAFPGADDRPGVHDRWRHDVGTSGDGSRRSARPALVLVDLRVLDAGLPVPDNAPGTGGAASGAPTFLSVRSYTIPAKQRVDRRSVRAYTAILADSPTESAALQAPAVPSRR